MKAFLLSVWILTMSVGCISAKTAFHDFSDIGDKPYTYIDKNASFTHHEQEILRLFKSDPFLGANQLYKGLHKRYPLGPNEAFINQRFDTVKTCGLLWCNREYILSADIVRFSHSIQGRTGAAAHTPNSPSPKPHGGVSTVVVQGDVVVACHNKEPVTGRPNPKTGKSTVQIHLTAHTQCEIKVNDRVHNEYLSPGASYLCIDDGCTAGK
jgi:hypothetical protein